MDASDLRTSNWLRYVNCARHISEQNVHMFQCAGRVYYMLVRDVTPRTELLIYYGPSYASALGIDVENYHKRNRTAVLPIQRIRF